MSGACKDTDLWKTEEEYLENDDGDEITEIEYIEEYIELDDEEKPITEEKYELLSLEPYDLALENSVWTSERLPYDQGDTSTVGRKIAQSRSGPLGLGKQAKTPTECLALFLDADVIATITEYTNERIKVEQANYTRDRDANPTDETELKALFGILFLAGSLGSSRQTVDYLFDGKRGTGMEAVYLAMSVHRFHFLLRCLQFDDPATSAEETEADKLAPVRAIYERVVNNFQKYFRPGNHLTMDALCVSFKGSCDFRQNIALPTIKTGFRFYALVDCSIPYTCNLEICVPGNYNPHNLSDAPEDVALRMTEPIQGKHKTVTLGRSFVSLETLKRLYRSRTMAIGEIPKSYPDIPKAFGTSKGRNEGSTLLAYHEMVTLMSHLPKRHDPLVLIYTCTGDEDDGEQNGEMDEDTESRAESRNRQLLKTGEPRLVYRYNETKNAVKLIQQMCMMYDTTRSTRRWQLTIFFTLMNLSAINAWCLHRMNNADTTVNRRDFLVETALELIRPLTRRRLESKTLPRTLRTRIGMFLGLSREEYEDVPVLPIFRKGSRGRCYLCGRSRNKTTRISCDSCGKFTCNTHCAYICHTCCTVAPDQA
ncbi:piggyBac transposable element-derived protein 3-like [Anopheles albimanus]|uniref:PiggyBac transposable element-derived protein domain-containing protein n=1 Tax=Anopheles albimanus TaxID=7167 RepID=A0A182FR75_ANOAL|nr:piggyBac transposable element-derived protein 3-like [Anopheles albimanus]XP_035780815.1 piggyBac transposable element-derived protein 3-like [Anopheles albimanus]XP_035780816.1 piggyBac transposable element-derived protein 3-like [Anopheles albimanus]